MRKVLHPSHHSSQQTWQAQQHQPGAAEAQGGTPQPQQQQAISVLSNGAALPPSMPSMFGVKRGRSTAFPSADEGKYKDEGCDSLSAPLQRRPVFLSTNPNNEGGGGGAGTLRRLVLPSFGRGGQPSTQGDLYQHQHSSNDNSAPPPSRSTEIVGAAGTGPEASAVPVSATIVRGAQPQPTGLFGEWLTTNALQPQTIAPLAATHGPTTHTHSASSTQPLQHQHQHQHSTPGHTHPSMFCWGAGGAATTGAGTPTGGEVPLTVFRPEHALPHACCTYFTEW